MIVLGVVCFAAVALAVGALIVILGGSSTSVFDLVPSDCFILPIPDEGAADTLELGTIETLDCGDPHDAEVMVVGELNPGRDRDYPPDVDLYREIEASCVKSDVDDARFGLLPVAPDEESWSSLGGRFVCLAVPYGGEMVTGTAG